MKVFDITVNDDGETVNVMASFSAKELQTLLQFAVNMSASIGLGVEREHHRQMDEDQDDFEDTRPELND